MFIVPKILTNSTDLACILSFGQDIISNLHFQPANLLTYTGINALWVNQKWLSDLIWGLLFSAGGYSAIINFAVVLVAISFTYVYKQMIERNPDWISNLVLLAIGFTAFSAFCGISERLFSYPLLLLLIHWLDKANKTGFNKINVTIITVITIIWANLNTDFTLGLMIILLYALTSNFKLKLYKDISTKNSARDYLTLFFGLLIASYINPFGIHIWPMILNYFTSGSYMASYDYLTPNFHVSYPYLYLEILVLLLIFVSLNAALKIKLEKLLLIVTFMVLSLKFHTLSSFWVILILPELATGVKNTAESLEIPFIQKLQQKFSIETTDFKWYFIYTVSILTIITGILGFPQYSQAIIETNLPSDAFNYLEKNYKKTDGNLLSNNNWSCYLHKKTGTKCFTTRNPFLHTALTLQEYKNFINIDVKFPKQLEKHNITWIISSYDKPFSVCMEEIKGWQKVYQDKKAIIFKRIKPYHHNKQ